MSATEAEPSDPINQPDRGARTMESHQPDRVALVFGLLFASIGSVTLVGLADVADVDTGVAVGVALVLAAVFLVVVTLADRREVTTSDVADDEALDDGTIDDDAEVDTTDVLDAP